MLHAVQKRNISDDVYDQMFNNIIEGVWKEGHKISSEAELCEIFQVSRATVREVLHRLKMMGVLETYHGKGTYVKKIDFSSQFNLLIPYLVLNEDDGSNLFSFMCAVQVECVRIVSKSITPEQVEELKTFLDQMEQYKEGDYDTFLVHDFAYHSYIVELTENVLFIRAMEMMKKLFRVYLRDIVQINGSEKSMEQHTGCLEALAAHDTEKAVKIMVDHYDMLLERLQRNWQNLHGSEKMDVETMREDS